MQGTQSVSTCMTQAQSECLESQVKNKQGEPHPSVRRVLQLLVERRESSAANGPSMLTQFGCMMLPGSLKYKQYKSCSSRKALE